MSKNSELESGAKWWVRYVIVPVLGSGGLIAIIVGFMNRPQPTEVFSTDLPQMVTMTLASAPASSSAANPHSSTNSQSTIQITSTTTINARVSENPLAVATPTLTPEQESTQVSIIITPTETSSSIPQGQWFARSYNADDTNPIIVNEHVVGIAFWQSQSKAPGDTGWIEITELLRDDAPNLISFSSSNKGGWASWGFKIKHNETTVWGNERGGPNDRFFWDGFNYVETLQILPDNSIETVDLHQNDADVIDGKWMVRATADSATSIILINRSPVAVATAWLDREWIDVTHLLFDNQTNEMTLMVWNDREEYSWGFEIQRDGAIVWGKEDEGTGKIKEILNDTLLIEPSGIIIEE